MRVCSIFEAGVDDSAAVALLIIAPKRVRGNNRKCACLGRRYATQKKRKKRFGDGVDASVSVALLSIAQKRVRERSCGAY